MIENLLAIVPGDGSNFAGQEQSVNNYYFDNFGEPFLYALIGFLVVIIGIAIIIGIIWLVGFIMRKTNNLEFLTKKSSKTSVSEEDAVSDISSSADKDEIPEEVKAAIVAAIIAYYEEKEVKCQFTVKRIKRI